MNHITKHLALICLLALTPQLPAFAENLRSERPTVIGFGGLWPKGAGLYAQYQVSPRLALGLHAGYALFFADLGPYARWYLDESPGSWYAEALVVRHFSLANGYIAPSFFSFNGLFGWEQRDASGWTLHAAAGLGTSFDMAPNTIMGLINLDAGVGYAF